MKLKTRFFIWIATFATLSNLVLGGMLLWMERQSLQAEINKNHAQLISRFAQVCEESLYQNDLAIFNYLKSLQKERAMRSAFFVNSKGSV
jgi:hypothetical protein